MSRTPFEKTGGSSAARAKGQARLTRADVVRAGAALLDADGVEQLSMRRLAQSLGTGPATLYWHVRDKDELLRAILDETLAGLRPPEEGTSAERLVGLLCACREALCPRPALVHVIWRSGWDLGPATLDLAETALALLADTGVPEDRVADAFFDVVTFLFGFVVAETSALNAAPFGRNEGPTDGDQDGAYPTLRKYGPDAGAADMAGRFRLGMSALVAGLPSAAG